MTGTFHRDSGPVPCSLKPREFALLVGALALAWIPVFLWRDTIAAVIGLYPIAQQANPYIVLPHAGALYVQAPLAALSSIVLLLSPGLMLTLALGAARSIGQWVLYATGLSIVLVSVPAALFQQLLERPLRAEQFLLLVIGCTLVCCIPILFRFLTDRLVAWPRNEAGAATTLATMIVVPLALQIVLAPKLYWENFNGDGAHAFETARLLLHQPLPFWSTEAGAIGTFPGVTSMLFVYPTSWFIRIFEETEYAARLPYLLYLIALFGALLTVIEHRQTRSLWKSERWLIWTGLVIYTVVMAFSATYSPYFADIALPATQDTLQIVMFLGFVIAFLQCSKGWLFFFTALTIYCSPNGLLLLGLWLLVVFIVWRPLPRRELFWTIVAMVLFLALSALLPSILARMNLPQPGQEYAPVSLLARFAFLQWADWRRVLYLLVPSGIIPALALLAWTRQDRIARSFTLLTASYFLFFYVQGHISLHHFSPIMVLPLVVLWRIDITLRPNLRKALNASIAVAGAVALILALPRSSQVHTTARTIGSSIDIGVSGYESVNPRVFRSAEALSQLFPLTWDPAVPDELYGGSPLAWIYYAYRHGDENSLANYLIQPIGDERPEGMSLLGIADGFEIYVRDISQWEEQRRSSPAVSTNNWALLVPRGILFRSVPLEEPYHVINVPELLIDLGLDLDPIFDLLGVEI